MKLTNRTDTVIKKVSMYEAAQDILHDQCPRYPTMYLCKYVNDDADEACIRCLENYLRAADCGEIWRYDDFGNIVRRDIAPCGFYIK